MSKMPTDILRIKMFETPESLAVEENQNRYDFGIRQSSMLVSMDFALAYLMFFELRRKILAEIIGKAENFRNFGIVSLSIYNKGFRKISRF